MASIVNTGGNQVYETVSVNLSAVSGVQDLYLVFTGGNGFLFNLNWIELSTSTRSSKDILLTNEPLLAVYPNPVVNTLTIENATGGTLKVYNVSGGQVLSANIESSKFNIDVSGLSIGVYYFRVGYNNELKVLKVIKN